MKLTRFSGTTMGPTLPLQNERKRRTEFQATHGELPTVISILETDVWPPAARLPLLQPNLLGQRGKRRFQSASEHKKGNQNTAEAFLHTGIFDILPSKTAKNQKGRYVLGYDKFLIGAVIQH